MTERGYMSPSKDTVLTSHDLLDTVLDAIPAMVLVVDREMKVVRINASALNAIIANDSRMPDTTGSLLRCTNTRNGVCGMTEQCKTCVIRDIVRTALDTARVLVTRARLDLDFRDREDKLETKEVVYHVTAAPFLYDGSSFVLLILEDQNESIHKEIVPICAQCKKVRKVDQKWEPIELFVSRRIGSDFSHTICPDCLEHLYPEISSRSD